VAIYINSLPSYYVSSMHERESKCARVKFRPANLRIGSLNLDVFDNFSNLTQNNGILPAPLTTIQDGHLA
jgi:hypothetical protein